METQPKDEGKLIHWRRITQSWFHSRKALLLLVTFAIATVALFVDKLSGDQWITLVKWSVPAYMAANVADGFLSKPPSADSDNS